MKVADLEKFLLALPATTLSVQWGHDRVLKVGGKMFAVIGFSDKATPAGLSFKASEDSFRLLTELPGIMPAPYLARAMGPAGQALAAQGDRAEGLSHPCAFDRFFGLDQEAPA
jgi:hypothetical protein